MDRIDDSGRRWMGRRGILIELGRSMGMDVECG